MTSPIEPLRRASALAEECAVACQHAELNGPRTPPGTIAGLQFTADQLSSALKLLHPYPYPARLLIRTAVVISAWLIPCFVLLATVPDPGRPWVFAATLTGTMILSAAIGHVFTEVRNRLEIRALPSGPGQVGVDQAIGDLRAQLAAITASLDLEQDTHLDVGREIEQALLWLDAVDELRN